MSRRATIPARCCWTGVACKFDTGALRKLRVAVITDDDPEEHQVLAAVRDTTRSFSRERLIQIFGCSGVAAFDGVRAYVKKSRRSFSLLAKDSLPRCRRILSFSRLCSIKAVAISGFSNVSLMRIVLNPRT